MYNCQKPHQSLGGLTPVGFEGLETNLSTEIVLMNKRKKEAKKEKVQQQTIVFN